MSKDKAPWIAMWNIIMVYMMNPQARVVTDQRFALFLHVLENAFAHPGG